MPNKTVFEALEQYTKEIKSFEVNPKWTDDELRANLAMLMSTSSHIEVLYNILTDIYTQYRREIRGRTGLNLLQYGTNFCFENGIRDRESTKG